MPYLGLCKAGEELNGVQVLILQARMNSRSARLWRAAKIHHRVMPDGAAIHHWLVLGIADKAPQVLRQRIAFSSDLQSHKVWVRNVKVQEAPSSQCLRDKACYLYP